jgi:hypothetical protein
MIVQNQYAQVCWSHFGLSKPSLIRCYEVSVSASANAILSTRLITVWQFTTKHKNWYVRIALHTYQWKFTVNITFYLQASK